MPVDHSKRNQLVNELYEFRASTTCSALLTLLDLMTQETREKNDDLDGIELYRNQGEIRAFRKLILLITKKLPLSG